ncbi:MAG: BRO-N domain-containing protein [Ktedonobacterales bacterium]
MGNDDEREAQTPAQAGQFLEVTLFDGERADRHIRRVWHDGRWFFSIVDVIGVLTESLNPRNYWNMLKHRLAEEGATETYTTCVQLKMTAPDGKQRLTDAADTEAVLRIVQSVPSPKAEPFKQWLARVGTERLQEQENPELVADRMRKEYERLGYSDVWISERLKNVVIRNDLTDEWRERGAEEGREFAILTDTLCKGTFDITTAEHRKVKHIPVRQNLRDSMTPLELVLTSLAELTAAEIHQTRDSDGLVELQRDAHDAGAVAGNARREVETLTGKPVVSPLNHKQLRQGRQHELQPPLLDMPETQD